MQCLPADYIPIRGSKGENQRLRSFMKQHPAYDILPDTCHKMAELDKKRMKKFVEKHKTKFLGVGELGIELDQKVNILPMTYCVLYSFL